MSEREAGTYVVCTVMIVNLFKHFINTTNLTTHKVYASLVFMACLPNSDSPHSEPGTIDEADNGTETHTSDEGQCIKRSVLFTPQFVCHSQYILVFFV